MNALNDMFGFIFKQPLHITLRQLRVVYIVALIFNGMWIEKLVTHVINSKDLDVAKISAIATLIVGLVSMFWKAIHDISKPIVNDQASE